MTGITIAIADFTDVTFVQHHHTQTALTDTTTY